MSDEWLKAKSVKDRYAQFRSKLDTTVPSLHFSWENQVNTVFTDQKKSVGRRKSNLTPQQPEADKQSL